MNNHKFVPGASTVRETNRGTRWYCTACAAYIRPIFIKADDTIIYPSCRECFYDDLAILQPEGVLYPKEVEDVEISAKIVSAKPNSPDNLSGSGLHETN